MVDATCSVCGVIFERAHGNRKRCLSCGPARVDTRRRYRPVVQQLAFKLCGECGGLFEASSPNAKFCSNRCINWRRERRRMTPCAVCGELMHRSRSSLPEGEAKHRRCRAEVLVHGRTSTYSKRGCRCDECRAANTASMREWTRRTGHWSKPEVAARRRSQRSTPEGRAKEREQYRRYYAENRQVLIAAAKAKEVRRKGAPTVSFTVEQLESRLSMFAGCWMCGDDLSNGVHVDHVKPLSRGGWHCLSNLRPSCPSCNLSKGAKWPLEKVMLTV